MTDKDFLDAIAASPNDESPHRIYADWLEENDRPEDAAYHRRWTVEVRNAEQWFDEFALSHWEPYIDESKPMEAAKIIVEAKRWLEERMRGIEWPEQYVQQGDDSLRNGFYEYAVRHEFWRNFATATGIEVPSDVFEDGTPFCCAC